MDTEYIYLLQEREFIKTNENIYKIGMTQKNNLKRFNQYPKGSILLFQMICNNCKYLEKILISLFEKTFIKRLDIGKEYFEGNYILMIDIIYNTIKQNEAINKKINETNIEITYTNKVLNFIEENLEFGINFKILKKDLEILIDSKKISLKDFKEVLLNLSNIKYDRRMRHLGGRGGFRGIRKKIN